MFGFLSKKDFQQFLETWQQTENSRREEEQKRLEQLQQNSIALLKEMNENKQRGDAESTELHQKQFQQIFEAWQQAENSRREEEHKYLEQLQQNFISILKNASENEHRGNRESIEANQKQLCQFLEAWQQAERSHREDEGKLREELQKNFTDVLQQINSNGHLHFQDLLKEFCANQNSLFQQFCEAWRKDESLLRTEIVERLERIPITAIDHLQKVKVQERKHSDDEKKKERLKAAIALNMCMVSVSQIVDYNDINILKLEYDAILNNLNLQNIIKDEPLLNALKAILDTCHFYILHEKDKEMLKKKQAARLKNIMGKALGGNTFAIFANPNPAALIAGAAVLAGSIAINYKTAKNEVISENEQEEWELQRTALEQLHNLRRTLFETAWRLADIYEFEDKWRLTEKQISIYNNILAEPDPMERYARLEAIQKYFCAYPIFWYYKARAALEVAGNKDRDYEKCDLEEKARRDAYREKALRDLQTFEKANFGNQLLREDVLTASAYMGYAHLLACKYSDSDNKLCDVVIEMETIKEYRTNSNGILTNERKILKERKHVREWIVEKVDCAMEICGMDFELLQMGAYRYLQCGEATKAQAVLQLLVNENYNMIINGKLLSQLLLKNNPVEYEILKKRIENRYSFPYRYIVPRESRNLNSDSDLIQIGVAEKRRVKEFCAPVPLRMELKQGELSEGITIQDTFYRYLRSELYYRFKEIPEAFNKSQQTENTEFIKTALSSFNADKINRIIGFLCLNFNSRLKVDIFQTMDSNEKEKWETDSNEEQEWEKAVSELIEVIQSGSGNCKKTSWLIFKTTCDWESCSSELENFPRQVRKKLDNLAKELACAYMISLNEKTSQLQGNEEELNKHLENILDIADQLDQQIFSNNRHLSALGEDWCVKRK